MIRLNSKYLLCSILTLLLISISSCGYSTFTAAKIDSSYTEFKKERINLNVALVADANIKEKILYIKSKSVGSVQLQLYPSFLDHVQIALLKVFSIVQLRNEDQLSSEKFDAVIYLDADFESDPSQGLAGGGRLYVKYDVQDPEGQLITRVSESVEMEGNF